MAAKAKKNARCPLQNECERKCEHVNRELECDYYRNNAVGDNVIPDQEELLELRNKLEDDKRLEEELRNLPLEDTELEENTSVGIINSSEILGELSSASEIRKIELGRLFPSSNNLFNVEDDITALAEDIKVNGLLSPLTVCPSSEENFYRIISGHRRYKALCSIYEKSVEVPCVVVQPKSVEAEEYMLIQANLASREIGWREKEEARKKVEQLLLDLKKQGHEFPGKLRTHVAQLLKTSEAQLAKSKYISEHTIEEIQTVPDDRLSFDDRYKIAHWSQDMQKKFFDKKIKKTSGRIWDVFMYDGKIKSGEDPFEKKPDSDGKEKQIKTCYRSDNYGKPCGNLDNFAVYKDVPISKFGVSFKCSNNCCFYCSFRHICPGACNLSKADFKKEYEDVEDSTFLHYRTKLALRHLLLEKGFDDNKIQDRASLEEMHLDCVFKDLVLYPFEFDLTVEDLLWYLSVLKMTPTEFFEVVKNHTDPPVKLENDIKPTWEIYLGEDRDVK